MTNLTALPVELAARLATRLPDAEFYPLADGSVRDLYAPLKHPVGVVSLQKLELSAAAIGDYLGAGLSAGRETISRCKRAEATVSIAIYGKTEARCRELFLQISQELLFGEEPAALELSCGAAEYRLPLECWRLPALLRLSLLLTREDPARAVRSIRLRKAAAGKPAE